MGHQPVRPSNPTRPAPPFSSPNSAQQPSLSPLPACFPPRAAQLFRGPAAHQLLPSLLSPTGGVHLSSPPPSSSRPPSSLFLNSRARRLISPLSPLQPANLRATKGQSKHRLHSPS
jgi:hypothetical protein